MDFKEVFKPPFSTDPGDYEIYIWCDGGKQMAFNLLQRGISKRIVALLNGEEGAKPFKKIGISENHQFIIDGYAPLLKVRGWGRLTGTGALNLHPEEAIKIQNDFVDWASKMLKGEYGIRKA